MSCNATIMIGFEELLGKEVIRIMLADSYHKKMSGKIVGIYFAGNEPWVAISSDSGEYAMAPLRLVALRRGSKGVELS